MEKRKSDFYSHTADMLIALATLNNACNVNMSLMSKYSREEVKVIYIH